MDYKVPTDYKTNPRFKYLTAKSNDELLQAAAIVKDNNVFRGYEEDHYMQRDPLRVKTWRLFWLAITQLTKQIYQHMYKNRSLLKM